jgi:hypothetical protein
MSVNVAHPVAYSMREDTPVMFHSDDEGLQ